MNNNKKNLPKKKGASPNTCKQDTRQDFPYFPMTHHRLIAINYYYYP